MFAYPIDEPGLYRWILFLMVGYLALAYIIGCARAWRITSDYKEFLTRIFDSTTFAGSVVLLWGIIDPPILKLLGTTTLFLLIAGVAGVAYSIHALFPHMPGNGSSGSNGSAN